MRDGMNSSRKTKVIFGLLGLIFPAITISLLIAYSTSTSSAKPLAYSGVDLDQASIDAAPAFDYSDGLDCRVGVTTHDTSQIEWVDDFDAGWYVSFGSVSDGAENGAEPVTIISVKQDKIGSQYLDTYTFSVPLTDLGLGAWIDANPGKLWAIGNEPDRGPDPGSLIRKQDDTFPDVYARAYHEAYTYIKDRDPGAKVANAGLVGATPGRLQYLDMVWQAYVDEFNEPMPVDVWNMHLYILPEINPSGLPNGIANVALGTDPALGKMESYPPKPQNLCALDKIYCYAEHDDLTVFAEQVTAMRQWMRDRGQRHKPLILSEFSILYPYQEDPGSCYIQDEFGNCFTPGRVINHMHNAINYMESAVNPSLGYPLDGNRLIQQWAWFSISNDPAVGNVSDLVKKDDTGQYTGLTKVGFAFQTLAQARSTHVNLLFDSVSYPITETNPVGGTADVNLWAMVGNNGNTAVLEEFMVTFYSDAALTQIIGTDKVIVPGVGEPAVSGCARQKVMATTLWSGLTPGVHHYWVEVDSGGIIVEDPVAGTGKADNVASGFVIVNPENLQMPVLYFDSG